MDAIGVNKYKYVQRMNKLVVRQFSGYLDTIFLLVVFDGRFDRIFSQYRAVDFYWR